MIRDNDYNIWLKVIANIEPYHKIKKLEKIKDPDINHEETKQKNRKDLTLPRAIKLNSKKNKKNKAKIDARLDLHGMTQERAFNSLSVFIEESFIRNKKKLLIITGKGKDSKGVLKRMLPLWLDGYNFKKYIESIEEAKLSDGGSGALYIYLKKKN